MVDVFLGGPVKDRIRKELDTPLIKEVSESRREKLVYFGLAGPLLLDIIEWQDYLKEFAVVEERYTGVKGSEKRNRQELLLKTSFITQLRDGRGVINDFLTVLYGDIDRDIILKGKGDFGKELPKQTTFGLIYLDYYGGIFKAKHREEAIKKLISNQKQNSKNDCDYALLLTVENLDKGKAAKRTLVDEILENLKDARVDSNSLENFKKFLSGCRYGLLQKIYVPVQIYLYVKSCGDEIKCYDPIIYHEKKMGTARSAEMLHFRFIISIKKNRSVAPPMIKDTVDICNLKLLTVEEDKITQYREQTLELRLNRENQ